MSGAKPDPNSRIRRAASILKEKGELVSTNDYRRVLMGLCETKDQWKNLSADLVRAGLVERIVRIK